MSNRILQALVATTALTAASSAMAQPADTAPAPAEAPRSEGFDEIVVTARRASERLQDVPVSVQVVTGADLQRLGVVEVEDISRLAPGLTLVNAGSNTAVTLRGVTWQPGSGTPATPVYFNEAPFDPASSIVSMYDIGQVEVLRGPQGTSRGAPSISGAITLTTHRPDLHDFGGFVQGLVGSDNHTNIQAALNIPILTDVLGIRLATNIDDSEGSGIHSVNSSIDPQHEDRSYRATVLFEPTQTFSIQAMYQQRKTLDYGYAQVVGSGSPGSAGGGPTVNPPQAPNFNGPALTLGDRASVQDRPSINDQYIDLLTVNAAWEVLGHTVSYNYGRQYNRSGTTFNASDPLNILPGFENFTTVDNVGLPDFQTNEIRLSSIPNGDRPFDYDIGWFSKESGGTILFGAPTYLTGAFGNPASAAPGAVTTPNSRYVLNSQTTIAIGQEFQSTYGNVRLHLPAQTELSFGVAFIEDSVPVNLNIQTFAAFNAVVNSALPSTAFCSFIPSQGAGPGFPSPVYTTGSTPVCEVALPNGVGNSTQNYADEFEDTIYNFSLSRRINDDLLVYFTTGSSFRSGLPAINNTGLPPNLVTPEPEEAVSYEIGFKSSIGSRMRLNADVFQLDYTNQLTTFEGVPYFNTVSGRETLTSLAFYRNIDALVRGFELEIAANPIDNLYLGVNLSYSDIQSQGGTVPCRDNTRPITALNPINFCASEAGEELNTQAPFQATINGSYEIPFGNFLGYVRFNANFQGQNPNFGNYPQPDGSFRDTDSYWNVDLFAGVSGDNEGWDLGIFAKNLFDEQVETNRIAVGNSVYPQFAAPAGYDLVRTNRPREVGVKLSYAFGSR